MNHQSHGGFRHYRSRDDPPTQSLRGIDAGGIGVAVVVHLPLSGPALHRRRRRSNLADREDWALFTDSLVLTDTMKTTATNALHIAHRSLYWRLLLLEL